jgi:hypothetical protein
LTSRHWQGFAGAGLYDSVMAIEADTKAVDYTNDPLTWDPNTRGALLSKLGEVATAIESLTGSAQDIEVLLSFLSPPPPLPHTAAVMSPPAPLFDFLRHGMRVARPGRAKL